MAILLVIGCGGGSDNDSHTPSGPGTAPGISNLQYSPASVNQGEGGGAVSLDGAFDFIDPDGDVDFCRFSGRRCGTGPVQHNDFDIPGVDGLTIGTVWFVSYIDTTCPPGSYQGIISVFDKQGNQSNELSATLTINP